MNEELEGLASRSQKQPTVAEVVELLKQGVKPQELIQYGITEELIMAAMNMLTQEMQVPAEGMGLASSVVQPIK